MKPIIEQICTNMRTEQEGELLRIVQSYGFNIDRTRLMAALTDARRFYNEGYEDGLHSSRWISVEERMPKKHDPVIAWSEDGYMEFMTYDGELWNWNGRRRDSVTHWMPLPEPPKEES